MKAVRANAMVGGDNARRSIAVGMMLGAGQGVGSISTDQRETLNHWEHSAAMLRTMPMLLKR